MDIWNKHCYIWTASSEFGTYRLCEQQRFRQACASAQSRQNLRCSLIQAVSQEEPSDRKPDPWPLWMSGHAQLKFVMTECSKTQIRLTGLKWFYHHLVDLILYCCASSRVFVNTSYKSDCVYSTNNQVAQYQNLSHLMTKPTKWSVRPAKTDQPGLPPSLIRAFAVDSVGS